MKIPIVLLGALLGLLLSAIGFNSAPPRIDIVAQSYNVNGTRQKESREVRIVADRHDEVSGLLQFAQSLPMYLASTRLLLGPPETSCHVINDCASPNVSSELKLQKINPYNLTSRSSVDSKGNLEQIISGDKRHRDPSEHRATIVVSSYGSNSSTGKNFLFDIGLFSTWGHSASSSDSLYWLHDSYTQVGAAFTEYYSWRPNTTELNAIAFFASCPGHIKPGYHYFHYAPKAHSEPPAASNKVDADAGQALGVSIGEESSDAPPLVDEGGIANDNPLNHILLRAKPSDNVVLKIYYTPAETLSWLQQISANKDLLRVIDEVYVYTNVEDNAHTISSVTQELL